MFTLLSPVAFTQVSRKKLGHAMLFYLKDQGLVCLMFLFKIKLKTAL